MATIVEYSDSKGPRNDYPARIVSPTRPSRCCSGGLGVVGAPQVDGQWLYEYRRCPTCGFTVRKIVQRLPDLQAITALQEALREHPAGSGAARP